MAHARKLRTQTLEEGIQMIEGLKDNRLLALIDFHIKYGFEGEIASFKVDEDYNQIRYGGFSEIFPEEVESLMAQMRRIANDVKGCMQRSGIEIDVYQAFCCRYLVDRKLGLTELSQDEYLDKLLDDYLMSQPNHFELREEVLLEQEWQQYVGDEEDLVFN